MFWWLWFTGYIVVLIPFCHFYWMDMREADQSYYDQVSVLMLTVLWALALGIVWPFAIFYIAYKLHLKYVK